WKATDARGFTTEQVFDYQEFSQTELYAGPLGSLINLWEIDDTAIEGDYGQGDVNLDNQLGPGLGLVVKTIHPTVTMGLAGEPEAQPATELFLYNAFGLEKAHVDPEGIRTEKSYYPASAPYGPPPGASADEGGYLAEVLVDPGGLTLRTQFYQYDAIGNVKVEISPRGVVTYRNINARGQITEVRRGDVDPATGVGGPGAFEETRYQYDLNDNIVLRKRLNTNPDTASHGSEPGWIVDTYEYDALDRLTLECLELIDPLSGSRREVRRYWHYDANGNLTKCSLQRADGEFVAESAAHDERNLLVRYTKHANLDPNPLSGEPPTSWPEKDFTVDFEYDDNGNLTDATDAQASHTHIDVDGFDRRYRITDPVGTVTEHTLDPAGLITKVVTTGLVGASGPVKLKESRYYYDERQRLYQANDKRFYYPDNDTTQDPLELPDAISKIAYDQRGLRVAVVDPNEQRTDFVFDNAGREIEKDFPSLAGISGRNFVHTTYDADGNVIQIDEHELVLEDGSTHEVVYTTLTTYDELNRRKTETVAYGTDEAGRKEFWYDSLGQTIKERNANAEAYTWGEESGIGTEYAIDRLGRIRQSRFGYGDWGVTPGLVEDQGDGILTKTMTWSDNGLLLSEADDGGNTTSYEYDGLNQRTRVQFADGTWETTTLRSDGLASNLTATKPGMGGGETTIFDIAYEYDAAKRRTQESVSLGMGGASLSGMMGRDTTYDGIGQVIAASATSLDPNDINHPYTSRAARVWDSQGHLVSEEQWLEKAQVLLPLYEAKVTCEYDAVGNRTRVADASEPPRGYDITYAFDDLGRIESVHDGATELARMAYFGPGGRLAAKTFPFNGTETRLGQLGWDARRRPVEMRHGTTSGPFAPFWGNTYAYSRTSNLVSAIRVGGLGSYYGDYHDRQYEYDNGDRLTAWHEG
ncbi:MAG: hypothetical protein AB1486_34910, partial [Planctomycetota bacterium]